MDIVVIIKKVIKNYFNNLVKKLYRNFWNIISAENLIEKGR